MVLIFAAKASETGHLTKIKLALMRGIPYIAAKF
jgi:hypothetical protein